MYLRHHTDDLDLLNEAFVDQAYRFPAPVWNRLASLGRPLRVLDVGADVGMFGLYVLERFPDARILALEPDPLSAVILRRCIRFNGRLDTWRVSDGSMPDVLELLPHHDLAKLSIVGEERRILDDDRLASMDLPILFVERPSHPGARLHPGPRLQERLSEAGFSGLWGGPHGPAGGLYWAWRS